MNLAMLEKAAVVVFAMCREHPEICPHDYIWSGSRTLDNGKKEAHYKCSLCGTEIVRLEDA